jgi:hypothetical protein
MATAMFAEMLVNTKHLTQLSPKSQRYTLTEVCFDLDEQMDKIFNNAFNCRVLEFQMI